MSPRPITLAQLSGLARAAAKLGLTLRLRGRTLALERWAGGEPLYETTNAQALAEWLG
jgi:hypothetical protein